MENKINGYLELNGSIFKISSIDDLKHFLSSLGKEMEEMTQSDFQNMCAIRINGNSSPDDCSVLYSEDGNYLMKDNNPSLEQYKIAMNTICITNHAFHTDGIFYNIKQLYLPNSVIAIGVSCFMKCSQLQTIIVSDNLQFIGTNAFSGCSNLTSFDFPKSLKYIESDAFSGCSSLTSITLPHKLRVLGSHAFCGCKSLNSVSLFSQDIEIGSGVFEGCSSLERIIIPKGFRNKYEAMLPFDKEKLIESE